MASLGTFRRGGGPQKKHLLPKGVGCIHYGEIYTHYEPHIRQTKSYVTSQIAAKSRIAPPGSVIIATTSENDDDLGRAVAWSGSAPIAVSNHTLIYETTLNPKYVSYFLRSSAFHVQKRRHIIGTKVRSLPQKSLNTICIPVHSADQQDQIVSRLDSLRRLHSDLITCLRLEITSRRKQYEYYRDKLLTFKELKE